MDLEMHNGDAPTKILTLSDFKCGEVFACKDYVLYIKTPMVTASGISGGINLGAVLSVRAANAVRMIDGMPCLIQDKDALFKVDGIFKYKILRNS